MHLKRARVGQIKEAREDVAHSKNLLPSSSETYRISAIVESNGSDLYKADKEIRIAIDLDPKSSSARYQYALFLLKHMEDPDSALAQIDEALLIDRGQPTLETARGLILTRLGRYQEAAGIYERILSDLSAMPRRWRIPTLDQAAECYRRWTETDRLSRDPAQQMAHLRRAREILDLALGANDRDKRTGATYASIVEDAIYACIASSDPEGVLTWLSHLGDASQVVDCPPFRRLSIERLAKDLPNGDGLVEVISRSAKTSKVKWHLAPDATAKWPARDEGKIRNHGIIKRIFPEEKFGFIADGEGKDWFFHLNHLLDPKQWESLGEGMRVGFSIGTNRRGECAVEIFRA